MSPAEAGTDPRLAAVQKRCAIGPYFLRLESGKRVAIRVPPEVRARPLSYAQMECIRRELAKRGLRLAEPARSPRPATRADLQAHLDRIHFFCELGPYRLNATSAARAHITIPPTMRVDPLTRRQFRCVQSAVERIRGVTLGPGIVPTVD